MQQQPPKIGTSHESRWSVDAEHAIELAPGRLPPVLSTPALVLFLERTALELMQPYCADDQVTVGVAIELEHLAASRAGRTVTCRARVIHVDGPLTTFQIEAHEGQTAVARGLHKRRTVSIGRLRQRLERA